jgi:hypothetical protein
MSADNARKVTTMQDVNDSRALAGRLARAVCLALLLALFAPGVASAAPEFGIEDFSTLVVDGAGNELTSAGSHPFAASTKIRVVTKPMPNTSDPNFVGPVEELRDVQVQLPPGFVGDPSAAGRCPMHEVKTGPFVTDRALCPMNAAVGVVAVDGKVSLDAPIYNVIPEVGYPAQFAFSAQNVTFLLSPELRSDSDYGINVTSYRSPADSVSEIRAKFCSWGVVDLTPPFSPDPVFECRQKADAPAGTKPFLTLPATECSDTAPVTVADINSWISPDRHARRSYASPLITACDTLEFEPSATVSTSASQASAATGLDVDLTFPQEDNVVGQAPPALKRAVVRLPQGMGVNPSAASGLVGCSDQDLRLRSKEQMRCPDASKVGEVTVVTPLLDEPVTGNVHIRSQASNDPESGEMFRLAIVLQNAKRGIDVRLPGAVRVDSETGRIETTFDNNPELPISSINVRLTGGPRGMLTMPDECGVKTAEVQLTSWGRQVSDLTPQFAVDCGGGQGAFAPGFAAGAANPVAGLASPFTLAMSRQDASEHLKSIDKIKLPLGLLANVASVELCGDADADRGTCGVGSRVGRLQVAAGAGTSPLWIPQAGKAPTSVSLTGPYRGAPYGLSMVVPAQAGPFDLGTVVVRSALHVDRTSAQVTSGVDQTRVYGPDGALEETIEGAMPRILKGVVLNQREIRVLLDRPGFVVNPTDCSRQYVTAELTGFGGGKAGVSSRFQVGECAALKFKPRLGLSLTGKRQMRTGKHPGVLARVRQSGLGEAGIAKAIVKLPRALALDPDNAQALCEFVDGTKPDLERHCPTGSIVGRARATTPLLERDLTGNVYFVKNVRRDARTGNQIRTLPMIVVALRGEIAINLKGESSTTKSGRLVNTFASVPDAPITQFNLNLKGGDNGILAVTRTRKAKINLCAKPKSHVAGAEFDGQNGMAHDRDVRVKTQCAKAKKGNAGKR